jgi:hypothetical protein
VLELAARPGDRRFGTTKFQKPLQEFPNSHVEIHTASQERSSRLISELDPLISSNSFQKPCATSNAYDDPARRNLGRRAGLQLRQPEGWTPRAGGALTPALSQREREADRIDGLNGVYGPLPKVHQLPKCARAVRENRAFLELIERDPRFCKRVRKTLWQTASRSWMTRLRFRCTLLATVAGAAASGYHRCPRLGLAGDRTQALCLSRKSNDHELHDCRYSCPSDSG